LDLHENFIKDVSFDNEDTAKSWNSCDLDHENLKVNTLTSPHRSLFSISQSPN